MKVKLIFCLTIMLCSFATYAASQSLWGDIDEPMQNAKDAVRDQVSQEKAEAAASMEVAKPIEEDTSKQKTVCEVLLEQPSLDHAALSSSTELLGELRTAIEQMPDEFKVLVSNNSSLDKLYSEYRAKYIKTYCKR